MRANSLTPIVAGLAVCAAAFAQPPSDAPRSCVPGDHYDPRALAQFAEERARANDPATAGIMRARAARILPSGPRIAPAGTASAPPPVAPEPPPVAPEPPPIWPAK